MKTILLNASTLNKGGGVQAATTFIRSALSDNTINWFFSVSKEVDQEVRKFEIPLEIYNKRSLRFDRTPARSTEARTQLLKFEKAVNPKAVFTFFGPAYVEFIAPHLLGVANPWVTHAGLTAYRTLKNPLKMTTELLGAVYRAYWFKKADKWVVEANVAKAGLIRRLGIKSENIFIVPNSFGQQFLDHKKTEKKITGDVKILVASAYYPHKNLEIIPLVAEQLVRHHDFYNFEFLLTLDRTNPGAKKIFIDAVRRGVDKHINLIGYKSSKDLPQLYEQCNIAFLLSLLEAFSANYPEAMVTGTPLVTTDLDFSRDACGNSAEYYNHRNPAAAAASLIMVIKDSDYATQLIKNGYETIKTLPNPREKYKSYLEIIESME